MALLLVAAATVLADRWPRATGPLAAAGSLALTVYVGQLVAVAAGLAEATEEEWVTPLGSVVATLALAWSWRHRLGRRPLERGMHAVSIRVSRLVR